MTDGSSIPHPLPQLLINLPHPRQEKASILGFFTKAAGRGNKGGDIYWTAVPKK